MYLRNNYRRYFPAVAAAGKKGLPAPFELTLKKTLGETIIFAIFAGLTVGTIMFVAFSCS